jgi:5-methyltetrahydropteroyltriglutamate--homocysteine methyltransferase
MIPTEPIGSIPRPVELIEAIITHLGDGNDPRLESLYDAAIKDTIARFEATGSPVVTDGEQRKFHNFWTYNVEGLENTAPDGFRIPFACGHVRRMPRLTSGPFRYGRYADSFIEQASRYTNLPIKQAVISASALSLMYPAGGIDDYPRAQFIEDLISEHVTEIRRCLSRGASTVQIDFTEARFAIKLDPSGELLASFIDLNNLALGRLTADERKRIGVHTCPGGDRDSTHSADVPYSKLLPSLFQLNVTNFYIAMAEEPECQPALEMIAAHLKPHQRIFVGVVSPIDPRLETVEKVRDRVIDAARHIPLAQFGTTDDCGFAPFYDDTSTSRDLAFAKIQVRVEGTQLAARMLGMAS